MRRNNLTLAHAAVAIVVVSTAIRFSRPLSDNSLFVHVRTGIDMIDSRSIPRVDPYSFAVVDQAWIVQSWLASAVYGVAHQVGGMGPIIVIHMVLAAVATALIVVMAKGPTLPQTITGAVVPVAMAWVVWSPRPLLFGVVAFGFLVWIVLRGKSPWWLGLVMWVWVNSHGGWLIGLAWLVAVAVGTAIDSRSLHWRQWRYVAVAGLGVMLAAVNPLGPKLLSFFTLALGERREAFGYIVEWQAPDFGSPVGMVTAASLLGLVVLMLRGQWPGWKQALPFVLILGMALLSARNMAMLVVAMAPLIGAMWPPPQTDSQSRPPAVSALDSRIAAGVMVVLLLASVLTVNRVLTTDPARLSGYPVAGLQWLADRDLVGVGETRLVAQDFVGGYLILTEPRQKVFIDDRVDMYALEVSRDYRHLSRGDVVPGPILDRYQADVVLWQSNKPLAAFLSQDSDWAQQWSDEDWVIYTRSN